MTLKDLKHIRIDQDKTILSLAETTGMDRMVISKIENAAGNPAFRSVEKLVVALGYEIVFKKKK